MSKSKKHICVKMPTIYKNREDVPCSQISIVNRHELINFLETHPENGNDLLVALKAVDKK